MPYSHRVAAVYHFQEIAGYRYRRQYIFHTPRVFGTSAGGNPNDIFSQRSLASENQSMRDVMSVRFDRGPACSVVGTVMTPGHIALCPRAAYPSRGKNGSKTLTETPGA